MGPARHWALADQEAHHDTGPEEVLQHILGELAVGVVGPVGPVGALELRAELLAALEDDLSAETPRVRRRSVAH